MTPEPILSTSSSIIPLEVIIAFLIFAMGIPTLSYQIAITDKLRNISFRTKTVFRWVAIIICAIIVISLLIYLWVAHPISPYKLSLSNIDYYGGISLVSFYALMGLISVIVYTNELTYKNAVKDLTRDCIRHFNKTGSLPEDKLNHLINLGQSGNSGYEKELVLIALGEIAEEIQKNKSYKGSKLKDIINGIEKVLLDGIHNRDPGNYIRASKIAEKILRNLRNQTLALEDDASDALSLLVKLGEESIQFDSEHVALMIVQRISSAANRRTDPYRTVSQNLFKLGVVALENGRQTLVAISALREQVELCTKIKPLKGETAADLLGLLSYFWVKSGHFRFFANENLQRIEQHIEFSLVDSLRAAITHMYQTTNFQAADNLILMLHSIETEVEQGY